MASGRIKTVRRAILLSAALVAALAVSGCQSGRDDEPLGTQEDHSDAIQQSMDDMTPQAPSASKNPAADLLAESSVEEKIRKEWIESVSFENEYAAILNELEAETLIIMAAAAEKKLFGSEDAPAFDDLMPELLKYNSEQATEPWRYIYEHDPGWLHEPYDLLYAHQMVESSLTVTEPKEGQKRLDFQIDENQEQPAPSSRHVKAILLQLNGEWHIDSIQSMNVAE